MFDLIPGKDRVQGGVHGRAWRWEAAVDSGIPVQPPLDASTLVPLLWADPTGLPSESGQIYCFSSKSVWWGNEMRTLLSVLAADVLPSHPPSLFLGLPAGLRFSGLFGGGLTPWVHLDGCSSIPPSVLPTAPHSAHHPE